MYEMNEQEKAQAIEAYERAQERRLKFGKIFVWILAGIGAFVLMASVLSNLSTSAIASAVIGAIVLVLFVLGYSWTRILYAIAASAMAVFCFLSLVVNGIDALTISQNPDGWYMVYLAVSLAVYIAMAAVLFTSRSVKEYMYYKRNG